MHCSVQLFLGTHATRYSKYPCPLNKRIEETKEGIKEKNDGKNKKKGKKHEKRNTCIKMIKSGDRCSKVAKLQSKYKNLPTSGSETCFVFQ